MPADAVFCADGTSYAELLSRLDAPRVPLADLRHRQATGRRYAVRHDVDTDLDHAIRFARMESTAGIRAVYFILHTGRYFRGKRVRRGVAELRELGHEVGIHHNVLTLIAAGRRAPPVNILNRALDVIGRETPVTAASAHGSVACYRHGFRNYELWTEFDPRLNEGGGGSVFTKQISLGDVGLQYEAYFLEHDHYLSDSARTWGSWARQFPRPFERMRMGAENPGKRVIDLFNGQDCATLQLCIHPCHWRIS